MTSSDRHLPRGLAVVVAASFVALLPAAAHAQRSADDIASARQLYNDGIELRDKGDLKGAVEKFRAAHALGNTPITGLDLCRTHSALNQPVEAREACLSVARIPPIANESDRSKGARSDAAQLADAERSKIAALRIKITGVPAGAAPVVVVDGVTVPAAALSEPRSVNPGRHAIIASVNRGPETRVWAETQGGETRDVEVAVLPGEATNVVPVGPADAPANSANPPPPKSRGGSTVAIVSFAIAGTAGLVGTIAGIKAMSGESDLSKNCQRKICGTADWDALDSAKAAGNVSTVAFVIAGVGLGAGLVALITSKPSKPPASGVHVRPVLGLGGGGFDGTF